MEFGENEIVDVWECKNSSFTYIIHVNLYIQINVLLDGNDYPLNYYRFFNYFYLYIHINIKYVRLIFDIIFIYLI